MIDQIEEKRFLLVATFFKKKKILVFVMGVSADNKMHLEFVEQTVLFHSNYYHLDPLWLACSKSYIVL